jgi:hypothetical protein
VSTEVDQLLDAFFGPGNIISRADAEANHELSRSLSDIEPRLRVPAVLPRRMDGEVVEWFVLCGDDTALRRAQAEVVAFIGPTYGRWDGIRARLNSEDPVEAAVDAFCDGKAIRFRTVGDDEFKTCWAALRLMRAVWAQRPEHGAAPVRTGATLVREFELAIAAGETRVSDEALAELRSRGLLGAENLRFLEIRQWGAEGRWRDIARAGDLADLIRIRRPWLVTEDILTALYRARIADAEAAQDPDVAVGSLRALDEDYPELLRTRGPLRSRDVVKLAAVRFAAADPPDSARLEALRDADSLTGSDRAWIATLLSHVRPPGARSAPEVTARDLLRAGDVDGAYAQATHDVPGVSRAELLIECAFELQTLEAAGLALDALDALTDTDRGSLLERRLVAVAIEQLRALAEPSDSGSPATPRSWSEWFARLRADDSWRAAEAVAVCGELEYEAADVVDAGGADALAEAITAAADSNRRSTVREALPHIIGWMDRQGFDGTTARPIHGAILTVLALDTAWGEAALEVAYNSAEALLAAGLDVAAYGELLEQLSLIWDRMAARRHVSWLADILELLELFPGPREPLVRFAAGAVGPVQAAIARVSPATREGLRVTLAGIGAEELVGGLADTASGGTTDEPAGPALAGRTVGIYTLTPQVGVRAKQAIEGRFPGVRVEVDSSHVSTPALEHLASTADILIVSIRSAKHAATDAIDRCRPRHLPTIVPGGRGSSRMVEALLGALR